LIVDLYGRACDANIFGAGPFTKFKRMYYAERFRHEWFNSEEIGTNVSEKSAACHSFLIISNLVGKGIVG
jgi:hypothetical protein